VTTEAVESTIPPFPPVQAAEVAVLAAPSTRVLILGADGDDTETVTFAPLSAIPEGQTFDAVVVVAGDQLERHLAAARALVADSAVSVVGAAPALETRRDELVLRDHIVGLQAETTAARMRSDHFARRNKTLTNQLKNLREETERARYRGVIGFARRVKRKLAAS
jgi:hypothetical protein